MNIAVITGQSILDISTQQTGTIENVMAIALANNVSPTDDLIGGQILFLDDTLPTVKSVTDYYSANNIIPGTQKSINPDPPTGVGNEFIQYPEPVLTIR